MISRVISYARVSTDDQGLGLEAQRSLIAAKALDKGWEISKDLIDMASGKSMTRRPGLQIALSLLREHKADAIVVAKLDRLSRSVADFGTLSEMARKQGWHIVVLDLELDTSTPTGEAAVNMMMVFAQLERRLIGLRTKEALAVKKRQGIKLGRPPLISPDATEAIWLWHNRGLSLRQIGAQLESRGYQTPCGNPWRASTIARVIKRAA